MRLLRDHTDKLIKTSLDLDLQQFSTDELNAKIQAFEPDVIFSLSDDENETVLDLALKHCCNMGFFKPHKAQLDETKLDKSRREQLAKIIFLDQHHADLNHFEQYGRIIHKDYISECENLLNFVFFCDTDACDSLPLN